MTSLNIYSLFFNGTYLFAGSQYKVFRSTNLGTTWDTSITRFSRINAFASMGSYLFAGEYYSDRSGDVYRSSDNGITWTYTKEYGPVFALIVSNDNIFVGNGTGIHTPTNGLERSLDTGATWIAASNGIGGAAHSFAVIGDALYAGTVNGLWRRPLSEFINSFGIIKADNLDFGNVMVADTICKAVEIHNLGNAPFTLTGILNEYGDTLNFLIDQKQFPARIKPGDSIKINICFYADTINYYDVQIHWSTDITAEYKNIGNNLSIIRAHTVKNSTVTSREVPKLLCFPSPTSSLLTIRNAPENLTGISILNVLGEKVMEITAPHLAEFTLDLSKWPAGIYYARFSSTGEIFTRKIVKN